MKSEQEVSTIVGTVKLLGTLVVSPGLVVIGGD